MRIGHKFRLCPPFPSPSDPLYNYILPPFCSSRRPNVLLFTWSPSHLPRCSRFIALICSFTWFSYMCGASFLCITHELISGRAPSLQIVWHVFVYEILNKQIRQSFHLCLIDYCWCSLDWLQRDFHQSWFYCHKLGSTRVLLFVSAFWQEVPRRPEHGGSRNHSSLVPANTHTSPKIVHTSPNKYILHSTQ